MTPNPVPAPHPLEQLRIERRSYILGTLLVWAVIITTWIILISSMYPQLFTYAKTETFSQAMARAQQLAPPAGHQQLLLYVVELVGAVALFFLNWRFSFLLQRPKPAFIAPRPGGRMPPARWLWLMLLLANSMFYLNLLLPQLILTFVLARWGKQELARRSAAPPPPQVSL
ncbi:MAG TPA: hypothetical protein VMV31_06855 [Terriglobales bacterium]|nr:hypothetical protein [Terriglobales bacterium]